MRVMDEAPTRRELAEILASLAELDPAEAPEKAEELAAELAERLDATETD